MDVLHQAPVGIAGEERKIKRVESDAPPAATASIKRRSSGTPNLAWYGYNLQLKSIQMRDDWQPFLPSTP